MDVIASLPGWMLSRIVWLDEACRGFAGHVLRSSAERRQHIAAYLSATNAADEDRGEAAAFLSSADHRSILLTGFKEVPSGLRGALRKSGPTPYGEVYYKRLYDLLSVGGDRVAEAIQHSIRLDPERLSIVEALSGKLCDSRISNRITTKTEASDLSLVADLLTRRGIDQDAFIDALCRSSLPVAATVQRWSLRVPFPPGPLSACDGYRPVRDGLEIVRLARKYRNCVRNYMPNLIAGNHAFGEFHCDGQDVLISFDRSAGYWVAEGVNTYCNRDVHLEVARAAYAFAAAHGVLNRRIQDRGDKALDALRGFREGEGCPRTRSEQGNELSENLLESKFPSTKEKSGER